MALSGFFRKADLKVKRDLWPVFWRGWTLDASWHAERMQALGVLFALRPLLERNIERGVALERHTAPFNANTWMAPALLAAMARLESERRGAEAVRMRDIVSPVLSGIGDIFVWSRCRPACLVLAVTGVLVGSPVVGLLTALGVYIAVLAVHTWHGFAAGAAAGADLARKLPALQPSRAVARAAHVILGLATGAWCVAGGIHAWRVAPSAAFLLSGALAVGYTASKRQLPAGLVFLGIVAFLGVLRLFHSPAGLP